MAEALYQDGGAFLTREGTLTLAFASAYGGSTVVYTGTSLTAPERVIRHWSVAGLDHADLVRRSAKYARQNNVHLLDAALLNDNNRLFVAGARAVGYQVEQFPVNLAGCRGSSLCNLGCPNQAKQGTNRVQLPSAERAGVEVVTRAKVRRIAPDRTLEVQVSERPPGAKGMPAEWAPGEYRVQAGIVICAGGAIGSPALLLGSALPARLPRLGEGFTCHPALILVAEHPHAITNDVGHPKSFFVDRAAAEGFVLETCMYFPFVTAKSLSGFGAAHSAVMRAFPRSCTTASPRKRSTPWCGARGRRHASRSQRERSGSTLPLRRRSSKRPRPRDSSSASRPGTSDRGPWPCRQRISWAAAGWGGARRTRSPTPGDRSTVSRGCAWRTRVSSPTHSRSTPI